MKKQKRELERQNTQLQRFSDGVTHELKNPLTVASQYVELYFEDVIEGREQQVDPQKAYDKISNAHTRIDEIIDNVGWLSKYSQTIEETEPVNIKKVSEEVWDSLEKPETAKLTIETDENIVANTTRFKSALDNLFKNSLRYASPDPQITIKTAEGKLYIEDNGPGIPKDKQSKVFEYGYTTSDEGTGFGLPVVKTIVESHGWEIEIDETYTDGVRFIISDVKFS